MTRYFEDELDANLGPLPEHAEHVRRCIKEEGSPPVLLAVFDNLMDRIWQEMALADSKIESITRDLTAGFKASANLSRIRLVKGWRPW